ncbi:complement component 1 Q subcomponent-binding protein, mitochondrial-like [Canis lupus familiaris]|uniref:complement component 1 Q subcomponent-binding protein, mitochondrial-like n=1 Tax=Canis lupus familiaris TaxID=9615 RepID=UPI000BAA1436|nr:complement component 1 Q subcomponent-binding protein, mitochondrial-like [Canis lupus familiaris]XP_025278935.1 complement component 1 Q subcomponent-binding protein, mitochondrial-like [Canis lupus dingo]XP_038382831.1 complement component 1 Q subcomponent-binding protein, mitochondrial-like [Canis lupus familiaris]XP_038510929.1 complement component 1 Q subcomponent-binding protein, mitochondrial-like [Canis lupus familiaris]|eukprot:XP_022276144.1 complement component 1 Q subcomponent-binding protein, mitochondrial-like [Canis lupus familiaris]
MMGLRRKGRYRSTSPFPKMSGGCELEVNGTEAKLMQKTVGEKITVTWNVNKTISPTYDRNEEPSQGHMVEEQEPELTATPRFVAEVIKNGGKKALLLDCHNPEDEVGQEEDKNDILSIRKVSFQSPGESEWKDMNYTLNIHSLARALYDHLMDFLAG